MCGSSKKCTRLKDFPWVHSIGAPMLVDMFEDRVWSYVKTLWPPLHSSVRSLLNKAHPSLPVTWRTCWYIVSLWKKISAFCFDLACTAVPNSLRHTHGHAHTYTHTNKPDWCAEIFILVQWVTTHVPTGLNSLSATRLNAWCEPNKVDEPFVWCWSYIQTKREWLTALMDLQLLNVLSHCPLTISPSLLFLLNIIAVKT